MQWHSVATSSWQPRDWVPALLLEEPATSKQCQAVAQRFHWDTTWERRGSHGYTQPYTNISHGLLLRVSTLKRLPKASAWKCSCSIAPWHIVIKQKTLNTFSKAPNSCFWDQVSRAWCLGGPNESYQLAKTGFNDSQQGIKNRNRGRNPALTTAQPLQLLCQICTESLEKKHLSDCRWPCGVL